MVPRPIAIEKRSSRFRQQERVFMTPTTVSLATAAEAIGTDLQTLRAVCNRLGLRDRQSDGHCALPVDVV